MTDHNSPAGAVGGGEPSGQPGPFGPPQQPQQPQQQAWQGQQPQPQQLPTDAARAQVAAAWVRNTPRAGQAAVPSLPPRETRPQGESKKEKRERERAARKTAYEQKKAEKEQRKRGGTATAAAPTAVSAASVSPASPVSPVSPAVAAPPVSQHGHPAPAASAQAASKPVTSAAPARDFVVPKPGGRIPTGGRRTHVALRATLLITTCVFALGSCGVMGLVIGKSSGPKTAGLDSADVDKYRLTDFPTQQAATFAEQYALLCMTFSPETASTRRVNLARYASAGVDAECGWSGEGTSTAVSATWDGTAETLAEYGDHGRYIGVQVRTDDGTLTTLTVPVYVKNLSTGEGMRVAGDVGQMPLPARADVPEIDQDSEVHDDALGQQLQQQVLPGYFEAWGASDATAMTRFTTPDASQAATSGLSGRLTTPTINDVAALVPKSVQKTDPYAYPAGQAVEVRVVVDWGDPKGETVRRAYRMTVVNTAQGWFIKDIRGGVLDSQGGRADNDGGTGAGTGTASPSASPSTSASASVPKTPKTPESPKGKPAGKS
ncbi:Conjugative transposon protein TcpC [Streptomyces sp. yr375]|uniref:conjugal transfer protein n=1 Tax=Streptomyces sp. yr375 TaxID=1761906 RepID=UPI0008D0EF85|nr:conjugal transfer protein [Streptomyces sp. yr375]SEQ67123.1 Conjugative transposon protein TcpC [Streptomyces sp. yr375]